MPTDRVPLLRRGDSAPADAHAVQQPRGGVHSDGHDRADHSRSDLPEIPPRSPRSTRHSCPCSTAGRHIINTGSLSAKMEPWGAQGRCLRQGGPRLTDRDTRRRARQQRLRFSAVNPGCCTDRRPVQQAGMCQGPGSGRILLADRIPARKLTSRPRRDPVYLVVHAPAPFPIPQADDRPLDRRATVEDLREPVRQTHERLTTRHTPPHATRERVGLPATRVNSTSQP